MAMKESALYKPNGLSGWFPRQRCRQIQQKSHTKPHFILLFVKRVSHDEDNGSKSPGGDFRPQRWWYNSIAAFLLMTRYMPCTNVLFAYNVVFVCFFYICSRKIEWFSCN